MIFYGPTSSVISIGALSRSFPHAIRSVTFFGLSLGYIHASKSHNRHEADLYFGPRGPNGRGGLVREERTPYGLAGGSLSRLAAGRGTRFKTSSVQPP